MTETANRPEALDEAKLDHWLARHVPGYRGPAAVTKFKSGQSNPTYKIASESATYVVRRKPAGALLKSAHAVDREFRVMSALKGTAVPVPAMLAYCADETVLGSEFYVMVYVAGRIFWDPALPGLSNGDRTAIYGEMGQALAALHSLDIAKAGLSDYGRPGDYFARQLSRWRDQYRASETGTLEPMETLISWLEAHLPGDDGRIALVHGDYRIDNMIFDAVEPRLVALLDWELSTIGHPFADLAYQCMQWRLPNSGQMRGLAGIDRAALGIPAEEAYVASYCTRLGISEIPHWNFYLAFSFFRLAAIIQGVKKRALMGNASDPEGGRKLGDAVAGLATLANALVAGKGSA